MLKDFARKCLYASGALGLYHRWRNADSLTVVMFHRILRPGDPRWDHCDPDYTLSEALFVDSLRFFRRHYSIVSLADVLRAQREGGGLPPRALLITFDDGWRDNVDYALPALQAAGMPAAMFVATDAVGARQPFYQERLIGAWRRGALALGDFAATMLAAGAQAPNRDGIAGLRELIAQLERMPPGKRADVLAVHSAVLDDGLRHMIDPADLTVLRAGGIELGLHGKTHTPMKRAEHLDLELGGARAAMAQLLARDLADDPLPCATLSFPHGSFDDAISARAAEAGYALQFTSVPVLNPVGERPSWLLGRTGYETDTVARGGRFRPDLMAWYLFRRETRRLA